MASSQSVLMSRGDVASLMLGGVFVFIGLGACAIAAVRRRRVQILLWFGIFALMYGGRMLAQVPGGYTLLPQSLSGTRPYLIAIITYLIIIPALMFWHELSLGNLRRVLKYTVVVAGAVGAAGVVSVFVAPSPYAFLPINNVIAVCFALVLAIANIPMIAKKYLVIASPVSTLGTLVVVVAVLQANLKGFLNLPNRPFFEPLAFGIFVFSLAWVASEKIFADERRLTSVENELAIARQIQASILPSSVPELKDIKVSVAYRPMTDVAGDFYEFIALDTTRAGFLVADVSGHGVPAALIAGMIKVAMQSVATHAADPGEVMRGLNRILSPQLRGQFVTAAYLWLDTENRKALYSAAGHPPLLRWRKDALERIESNGLLFGVLPQGNYPVHNMPIYPGDRFLLYTDGVIEPENARGDSFGDTKLESVLRSHSASPANDLSDELLAALRRWQPPSVSQQDDITLLVIDIA